jgi:hypothetical protein
MRPQLASCRLLSARLTVPTGRPRMPVRPGSVHRMHAASSSSNTRGATGANCQPECRATRPGAVSKFKGSRLPASAAHRDRDNGVTARTAASASVSDGPLWACDI